MSKRGKFAYLGAVIVLIVCIGLQFMTGMWINLNSVLLALSGAFVVLAIGLDWPYYWEFLTMRTTKHGINMGAMIVMVIALVVCVNFLANRHNKTWDVTQEKLNSLSEQSVKILSGLKDDVQIKIFFQGPSAQDERSRIKQVLDTYRSTSPKIKVEHINSFVDTAQALTYLKDLPDKDTAQVVVFLEHAGKKIRVDPPFDEGQFTAALIKATRTVQSKVYFLAGHGEKNLDGEEDQGLKDFVRMLSEASFEVEPLNLIDRKEIPKDAALLAIVGPQLAYLDAEMQWLREYMRKGGRLLIALDPGQRHNLANLTKTLGVQFANNYVLSQTTLEGGGPATIIGRFFDATSAVTSSFPNGASFAIFPLASEVSAAADRVKTIEVREIVKSDTASFTVVDPTKPLAQAPEMKSVPVAVQASGTFEKSEKPFEAIVFGDSDFLANRGIMLGVNRDLALNAIAQLAEQKDLISIKPKLPAGTLLTLTTYHRLFVVIAGISLPLFLLIASGVLWFRRRGA